jgi:hypothetical protein
MTDQDGGSAYGKALKRTWAPYPNDSIVPWKQNYKTNIRYTDWYTDSTERWACDQHPVLDDSQHSDSRYEWVTVLGFAKFDTKEKRDIAIADSTESAPGAYESLKRDVNVALFMNAPAAERCTYTRLVEGKMRRCDVTRKPAATSNPAAITRRNLKLRLDRSASIRRGILAPRDETIWQFGWACLVCSAVVGGESPEFKDYVIYRNDERSTAKFSSVYMKVNIPTNVGLGSEQRDKIVTRMCMINTFSNTQEEDDCLRCQVCNNFYGTEPQFDSRGVRGKVLWPEWTPKVAPRTWKGLVEKGSGIYSIVMPRTNPYYQIWTQLLQVDLATNSELLHPNFGIDRLRDMSSVQTDRMTGEQFIVDHKTGKRLKPARSKHFQDLETMKGDDGPSHVGRGYESGPSAFAAPGALTNLTMSMSSTSLRAHANIDPSLEQESIDRSREDSMQTKGVFEISQEAFEKLHGGAQVLTSNFLRNLTPLDPDTPAQVPTTAPDLPAQIQSQSHTQHQQPEGS